MGAAGFAIEKGVTPLNVWSVKICIFVVLFGSGAVVLVSFHFMDRFWYHRPLKGAVIAGSSLEETLQNAGVTVDLGQKISESSPFTVLNRTFHSQTKIDIFYCVPINMFIVLALAALSVPSIMVSIPVLIGLYHLPRSLHVAPSISLGSNWRKLLRSSHLAGQRRQGSEFRR